MKSARAVTFNLVTMMLVNRGRHHGSIDLCSNARFINGRRFGSRFIGLTESRHGPRLDQHQGGTPPAEFASDLEKLRILFNRFCTSEVEFAPRATLGQMSRSERMRHAYLHMDHHLRQFGA